MDLAISDLNMIEKEDKYLLKIRLANLGNLSMKGIVFRIEVEDAMVFEELYDTLLIIGDSYLLELNTQLLNQAEYICVSALPNSIFSDIDLENNTVCLTLSKQEDLLKLYPNPVADELNLLFNSNENKTLEFNIINDLGQTVRTIELDIKKGLFKYSLTTKKLNQGHYILKFEDFTKKFIKE
jgi:hypothetical protein